MGWAWGRRRPAEVAKSSLRGGRPKLQKAGLRDRWRFRVFRDLQRAIRNDLQTEEYYGIACDVSGALRDDLLMFAMVPTEATA